MNLYTIETVKLNKETRKIWAEKTFELTNIGTGVLFFGQFVSGRPFSISLAFAGFTLILIGYLASLVLMQKK